MASRERARPRSDEDLQAYDSLGLGEVTDEDIEAFVSQQEAEEEKKKEPGFLNLQTGSGLALIGIGTIYMLQQMGLLPLGWNLGALVAMLPWLAGILIILTGFGVLSWSPTRRRRKNRRRAREKTMGRQRAKTPSRFGNPSFRDAAQQAADAFDQATESAGSRIRGARSGKDRQWTVSATSGRRRLAKSRRNRKIAGVASGIAAYIGVDPVLVRIAFVIATIAGWPIGPILYGILALALPKADEEEPAPNEPYIRVIRDDD